MLNAARKIGTVVALTGALGSPRLRRRKPAGSDAAGGGARPSPPESVWDWPARPSLVRRLDRAITTADITATRPMDTAMAITTAIHMPTARQSSGCIRLRLRTGRLRRLRLGRLRLCSAELLRLIRLRDAGTNLSRLSASPTVGDPARLCAHARARRAALLRDGDTSQAAEHPQQTRARGRTASRSGFVWRGHRKSATRRQHGGRQRTERHQSLGSGFRNRQTTFAGW